MIRFLVLLLVLALPTRAQVQPAFSPGAALAPATATTLQAGLTRTADGFILPAYAAQAEATARLEAALAEGCADLGPARAAYADTFLAWQRASLVGIGPITEDEGALRVQLWPDPKGFADRAVRAAIAAEDPALLMPDGLEGRSIALTNLTALEGLLFAPAGEGAEAGGYACDLAHAVAAFQAGLAAQLEAAWTPGSDWRDGFDALGPDIVPVLRKMLAGAVVQVDRLRKFKMLRGLGEGGRTHPERTEAAAAGLGLPSIAESFAALADFYEVPGGVFDAGAEAGGSLDYLTLAQTARGVADTWAFEPAPLTEIVAENGPRADELRRHADLTLRHEVFLKAGFLAALGLTAGFTAADGD